MFIQYTVCLNKLRITWFGKHFCDLCIFFCIKFYNWNGYVFRLIQANSASCVTLAYSHLAIFRPLAYLEPEVYSKPCETLIRHIHNLAIDTTVWSSIIQPYSVIFGTLCNSRIYRNLFGILEYSEAFHNCILMHIQNSDKFTKISKPCVTLEIQNPGILTIME